MSFRKGFTLVEMLVALALTMFMMAILSEAFVTGLKAFRRLKAIGDMDQQLRTAAIVLRRDLQADHFDGYRRLSSYRLGTQGLDGLYDRPQQGFFCVREGATTAGVTSVVEGLDGVNRPSIYDRLDAANGDLGDSLHFSIRLAGNRPETFFYGAVPRRVPNANPPQPLDCVGQFASRFDASADRRYASQWAEVAYFIERDGTRATYDVLTGQSMPIYRLYRTQLLLVPEAFTIGVTNNAYVTAETNAAWDNGGTITVIDDVVKWQNYFAGQVGTVNEYAHDVSAYADNSTGNWRYLYNTPADVQFRERRYGELAGNYVRLGAVAPAREGADLLAVNVLSWDVKVYDPYAIKATLLANANVFRYVGEFVDLGHLSTGTTNLPMPTTDGTYSYAWNQDATNVNNGTYAPLFRTNGNNATLPRTFDTWSNRNNGTWNYLDTTNALRNLPYPGPVQAVQITIRIWDEVTQQTRQITIVQDM